MVLGFQLVYPSDRMLPLAKVDGKKVGLLTKDETIKNLNQAYQDLKFQVYLGASEKAHLTSSLKQAGVIVDNSQRIKSLEYPWYLRIVPTSIFWAQAGSPVPKPTFSKDNDKYIQKELTPVCREKPIDATLKFNNNKLEVVKSKKGGECKDASVIQSVKEIQPKLGADNKIRIDLKEIEPSISDEYAKDFAKRITDRVGDGVPMTVSGEQVIVPSSDILSWLDFSSSEGTLGLSLNPERATPYLDKDIKPKVTVQPGTSFVTTKDFDIVSNQVGTAGQALNVAETLQSLEAYLNQVTDSSTVVTQILQPLVKYTRTYSSSDEGLNALLKNFANDHPGTFGVTFVELAGQKRRASYNGDKQFITASTYKLFVAYSLLRRIESGSMDWASNEDCFNRMIINSDNACPEAYLKKIGLKSITDDIQGLGLINSTFMKSGGPFTTADDLALFMGMLESGQSLNGLSRERLINAGLKNVYRKGIPAGASGAVSDKVGFLNGLLHDSAIVYSPAGTYVLAILTDGSSWQAIADLTKQIETLRSA